MFQIFGNLELCLRPAEPEEVVRKVKKDPMAEVTGDAPDKWDKVVGMCLVSSKLYNYKTACKVNTMELIYAGLHAKDGGDKKSGGDGQGKNCIQTEGGNS